ncbi:uncharacterized protein BO66DRAFT_2710 [Aspergillus aculeatinus CBS 121060]|uniref:Uncharacterized protein n=1 Tax=Aspergillus aculeatinus CBS 121060 TaxID=1448322 RepID=A0ACD1HNQ6_9EURO|nr:hypothetical protein BO66DRAFT_2710 [Aspergillus aculeatinus CBS 121060]RAH75210.1 hypothetical protein BO66DRAFT_2710 [Aspergillus aculeatinus CBS 121060]
MGWKSGGWLDQIGSRGEGEEGVGEAEQSRHCLLGVPYYARRLTGEKTFKGAWCRHHEVSVIWYVLLVSLICSAYLLMTVI